MSIRTLQIKKVYDQLARVLYAEGVKPTLTEVSHFVSKHFSKYPAGQPLPVNVDFLKNGTHSDPDAYNQMVANFIMNLETLYEVAAEIGDELMKLNTDVRDNATRLTKKRRAIENKIDDFLLSLYNSDGYFYSISDTFANLDLVDLSLTSAYVATDYGVVTLPILSDATKRIVADDFDSFSLVAQSAGQVLNPTLVTPYANAVDGLTNTAWTSQVELTSQGEVVAEFLIGFTEAEISKIEVSPFMVSDAQWSVSVARKLENGSVDFIPFGNKIITTKEPFAIADAAIKADTIKIIMRKKVYDYEDTSNGGTVFRYLFGIKDLVLSKQVYDSSARFVSAPLYIPDSLSNEMIIDAVSMTAAEDTPPSTTIDYFVAIDEGGQELGDFDWQAIESITESSSKDGVVRFNSSARKTLLIKESSTSDSDVVRIPLDTTNPDLTKRNPSPLIVPDQDVYRIAPFKEELLLNSVSLEEGINLTNIYHRPLTDGLNDSINAWKNLFDTSLYAYGRVDAGNDFFYGGDVGESGRSVYVETTLDVDTDEGIVFGDLQKLDANAASWDVRLYLNGRELAYVPAGTKTFTVPWSFKRGENKIVALIDIPAPTEALPDPYVGSLNLFGDKKVYDYGRVRLDSLSYVDDFEFKYNQYGASSVFTIINDEIVTRKVPIGSYRLVYNVDTGTGPTAIRLRADLNRTSSNATVSPVLSSYRIRFAYSEE